MARPWAPLFVGPLNTGALSISNNNFATWESGFMRFVSASCLAMTLMFSAVVQADVAKGKSTYAARGCIGCHGAGGVSTVAANPSLKGRSGDFIRKNLTDFRSGARNSPVMNAMAAGLQDADIENLANYVESLK
jgi:cytochrome c553